MAILVGSLRGGSGRASQWMTGAVLRERSAIAGMGLVSGTLNVQPADPAQLPPGVTWGPPDRTSEPLAAIGPLEWWAVWLGNLGRRQGAFPAWLVRGRTSRTPYWEVVTNLHCRQTLGYENGDTVTLTRRQPNQLVPYTRIELGDASESTHPADLVFTHPYAPLPPHLQRIPAIINLALPRGQAAARIAKAESWVGGTLQPIGSWAEEGWNTVFVCRWPARLSLLTDLRADPPGFFPQTLVDRIFRLYRDLLAPGMVVWDGFMGRGSVGKGCQVWGFNYIGLDRRPERVRLATTYLGLS